MSGGDYELEEIARLNGSAKPVSGSQSLAISGGLIGLLLAAVGLVALILCL